MKLKRIDVENFKSIEALSYEPTNKTVALIGPNGKGKTAFREALYAGITGDFPASCIKNGTDHSTVTIELSDGTEFSRTLNASKANKVTVNGRVATAKGLTETIESRTGVGKEAMRNVTSADVIEGMKPDEFGDFILSYIPEELDYEQVVDYMNACTPKIENELLKVLPVMPSKFGMDALRNAYEFFVEQRKISKKELATRQAKIAGFTLPEPKRTLAEIEKELTEIIGKDASQASAKKALEMYASAVKIKKQAEDNLTRLREKIDAIVATKPAATTLTRIEAELSEARKQIVDAKTMINTINDNIDIFQNTIENLGKPVCPLSEKLVCTTDKTKIKEELEEIIASNKEGLELQQEIVKKAEAKIEKANKEKTDYESNARKYNEKVMLNSQYEDQKKSIPILPPKPDDVEIADYSEEKEALQRERDEYVAYKAHEKDLAELEVFTDKVGIFNTICKELEPKGEVVTSIMEHYLEIFEDTCNSRAKALRADFEIKFIAADGVSYMVKTSATSDFKTYDALSTGERTLTMFLILDMLNVLSGLKIMMLDDLDNLDHQAFDDLITLVQGKEVQDFYDHIVICAVNHDDIVTTLKKYGNIDFI